MNEFSGFYKLGIAPGILSILDKLQFTVPTPIQERSIPLAIEGKDLIGIAQTGTGKTLAFGIPMIQGVLRRKNGIGLVVLPTRELARQVEESLQKIGRGLGIKTALLIGGAPMGRQISDIRRRPDIVIGTPGRIIDHLEQRILSLSNVGILVLDEADRMLDMGFAPQLKRILQSVPTEKQTMLFSATMPPEIGVIAKTFMKLPLQIEIAPPGTAADNLTQEVFMVGRESKDALLKKLLYDYKGSVLVFSRTKHGAKRIAKGLRDLGHTSAELHSNRSLNQRKDALSGFDTGRYRVLVATDIAARGIDVQGIEVVINYDLPMQAEDYVHRIGRTGRAGASGHAISFATPDQLGDLRDIERLLHKPLPVAELPDSLPKPVFSSTPSRPAYGRRPPFRSSRSHGYSSGGTRREGGHGRRPSYRPSR